MSIPRVRTNLMSRAKAGLAQSCKQSGQSINSFYLQFVGPQLHERCAIKMQMNESNMASLISIK